MENTSTIEATQKTQLVARAMQTIYDEHRRLTANIRSDEKAALMPVLNRAQKYFFNGCWENGTHDESFAMR